MLDELVRHKRQYNFRVTPRTGNQSEEGERSEDQTFVEYRHTHMYIYVYVFM